VLRVEALAELGDRESARRLARRFLSDHPNTPYARRLRSFAGADLEPLR
jgi:hypothetical protein